MDEAHILKEIKKDEARPENEKRVTRRNDEVEEDSEKLSMADINPGTPLMRRVSTRLKKDIANMKNTDAEWSDLAVGFSDSDVSAESDHKLLAAMFGNDCKNQQTYAIYSVDTDFAILPFLTGKTRVWMYSTVSPKDLPHVKKRLAEKYQTSETRASGITHRIIDVSYLSRRVLHVIETKGIQLPNKKEETETKGIPLSLPNKEEETEAKGIPLSMPNKDEETEESYRRSPAEQRKLVDVAFLVKLLGNDYIPGPNKLEVIQLSLLIKVYNGNNGEYLIESDGKINHGNLCNLLSRLYRIMNRTNNQTKEKTEQDRLAFYEEKKIKTEEVNGKKEINTEQEIQDCAENYLKLLGSVSRLDSNGCSNWRRLKHLKFIPKIQDLICVLNSWKEKEEEGEGEHLTQKANQILKTAFVCSRKLSTTCTCVLPDHLQNNKELAQQFYDEVKTEKRFDVVCVAELLDRLEREGIQTTITDKENRNPIMFPPRNRSSYTLKTTQGAYVDVEDCVIEDELMRPYEFRWME